MAVRRILLIYSQRAVGKAATVWLAQKPPHEYAIFKEILDAGMSSLLRVRSTSMARTLRHSQTAPTLP